MNRILQEHRQANLIYQTILHQIIEPLIGSDQQTYQSTLMNIGRRSMKKKFVGVFPADRIPDLKSNQSCILNLDKAGKPGSHWIAVVRKGTTCYVYDSFGRPTKKIIKNLISHFKPLKVVDTEHDAEQEIKENNCGQRCLAWLCLFYEFGIDVALLI